jgi:hypothetical protein
MRKEGEKLCPGGTELSKSSELPIKAKFHKRQCQKDYFSKTQREGCPFIMRSQRTGSRQKDANKGAPKRRSQFLEAWSRTARQLQIDLRDLVGDFNPGIEHLMTRATRAVKRSQHLNLR